MAGETILVVDDDEDIREVIVLYLKNAKYHVVGAKDGFEAVKLAQSLHPDLIILDMMLPGLDGIEVCQEIRKGLNIPIIFLSCKDTPIDKSLGLTAGADDYMGKPFEAIELVARVKAHLRRSRMSHGSALTGNILKYPGLTINLENYSVQVEEKPVTLAPKEFQLLALLAQNPDKVFSPEELFRAIWETESFGDNRTVMVHISNIRHKIEKNPADPKIIQNIKGVGYKLNSNVC